MDFKQLGLRDKLVKATESLGFQSPMPVQEKAMPVLLSGEKDFVGLAQTGTGKTGAFGLPLLQLIDTTKFNTQGIVICPTRERKKHLDSRKSQRFFINMGRLDKINKGAIVRLICDKSGIGPDMIGEISLNREFSFFEVQKQAAKRVHNSLNDAKLNGRTVEVHNAM